MSDRDRGDVEDSTFPMPETDLRTQLAAAEAKIAKLKAQLEDEVHWRALEGEEYQEAVATHREKRAIAEAERDRLAAELRDCRRDAKELVTALDTARAERDQARAEVERLRSMLELAPVLPHTESQFCGNWYDGCHCMEPYDEVLAADRDRLRTLLERAVGALEGVAPFLEPSPSARVDELSDRFYRATGVMAPGKSVAMEMAMSQPPDDVCRDQYAKWLRQHLNSLHENTSATIAAIRSALDDARDQEVSQ